MNRFKSSNSHRLGQVPQNYVRNNLTRVASQKSNECKCEEKKCDEHFEIHDVYNCSDSIQSPNNDEMNITINTKSKLKFKINSDLCINKTYPTEWA